MLPDKPEPVLRIFAVFNDKAGRCLSDRQIGTLKRSFGERWVGATLPREQTQPADAIARAIDAKADTILVAGGDGSVTRIAREMIGKPLRLGILPCGTANIMARHLRIPLDPAKAARVLDNPRTVLLDGIDVNGRVTFSHVSMGIYANAAYHAAPTAKRSFRRLSYFWEALKEMRSNKHWQFRIVVDGEPHAFAASTVMLANVGDFGFANWQWASGISAYDGVLDVCAIRAQGLSDYGKVARDLIRFKTPQDPRLVHLRAREELLIEADSPLPLRGDGDRLGTLPARIKVLPGILPVLVPPLSY